MRSFTVTAYMLEGDGYNYLQFLMRTDVETYENGFLLWNITEEKIHNVLYSLVYCCLKPGVSHFVILDFIDKCTAFFFYKQ